MTQQKLVVTNKIIVLFNEIMDIVSNIQYLLILKINLVYYLL